MPDNTQITALAVVMPTWCSLASPQLGCFQETYDGKHTLMRRGSLPFALAGKSFRGPLMGDRWHVSAVAPAAGLCAALDISSDN